MIVPDYPIQQVLPDLKKALASGSAVLAAPPGSGKTTIVPLALLDEPWLDNRSILILEPRRLATRAAAHRMSALLSEPIGQRVGYQIRFDRKISARTRIEVLTEGILTRRIQSDPDLSGVGLIIFDEFHERSVHADLALALCLDLCQVNGTLRLLVMSATLDTAPIAALLGDVPIITGDGKSHDVAIDYLHHDPQGHIAATTAAGVRRVLNEQEGDLLVFLPGRGEIHEVRRVLAADKSPPNLIIQPLFGDLSQQEQDRAIQPDPLGKRRVILATSIAETSLTIEGIRCVIDCGWSRRPLFNPSSGLTRLTTVRVSKAVADQRSGRAGRLGPGYCLRLWTKQQQHGLQPYHAPEISAVDLAPLALELALWGVINPNTLRWLDPPREGPWRQARELLSDLAAIDQSGHITETGKELAALPIHPRLGHMLLMAKKLGQGRTACEVAAILSEKDLIAKGDRRKSADLQLRLQLLAVWRQKGSAALAQEGGDPSSCRRIDQLSRQYQQLVQCDVTNPEGTVTTIGSLLAYAYPDRIARRRPGRHDSYLLAGGRGALLPPADPLSACEYLVIPQIDAGHSEGRIFLAEALSLEDLEKDHTQLITRQNQVFWDEDQKRVKAVQLVTIGAISISEHPWPNADLGEITLAIQDGIRRLGLAALPWNMEARQLQARISCLKAWQSEAGWPSLDDAHLLADLDWLSPWLTGITTLEQLQKLNLVQIFTAMLDWHQQQTLEDLAPTRISVPSGSNLRIDYVQNGPPVLPVRLQELFGLSETPAICRGQVPLLLHLLSPARRPIQITTDLKGFWQRSYPEIKKELKGRYPKHFWPDDPSTAKATSRVKKRMT